LKYDQISNRDRNKIEISATSETTKGRRKVEEEEEEEEEKEEEKDNQNNRCELSEHEPKKSVHEAYIVTSLRIASDGAAPVIDDDVSRISVGFDVAHRPHVSKFKSRTFLSDR